MLNSAKIEFILLISNHVEDVLLLIFTALLIICNNINILVLILLLISRFEVHIRRRIPFFLKVAIKVPKTRKQIPTILKHLIPLVYNIYDFNFYIFF